MTFKRSLRIVIPVVIWVYLFAFFLTSPRAIAQSSYDRQEALSQRIDAVSQRINANDSQNIPQRLAILETKADASQKTLDKIEGWAERGAIAILYLIGDSIVKLLSFYNKKRAS